MAGEAASHSLDDRARLRRVVFWRRAVVEGGRWLYGALGHLLFVVGLLALAGVVVVVFDWPVWLIGFVVGLILLAALAEGAYRTWRDAEGKLRKQRSAEVAAALLYMKCTATGAGIQVFVNERRRAIPTLPPDKAMALAEDDLPLAEEYDYKVAVIGHEHDTQAQYKDKFAVDVFKIVADLRQRGYVSERDMEWLNYPTDLEGIERVGERLWEIGNRVKPEHWKQAKT